MPNRPIHIDTDPNRPVKQELDPVLQLNANVSSLAPTTGTGFNGVGNGFTGPQGTWTVNVAPPDTVMDVGPSHIVQAVNSGFAVINKTGTVPFACGTQAPRVDVLPLGP